MTNPDVADAELDALLDYLRESRGFDFGGYKRTGLARRITHRMGQVRRTRWRCCWPRSLAATPISSR
ncbi:hypothetical protein [Kribbella sp. NPDC023855]|uniref:hypothetical protein n=1 Tax=Kribbella sp. NPDC023855 TaxID=3154698 RepID=UPI0033F8D431